MDRIWHNKFSRAHNSFFWYWRYTIAFFSFGLLAPLTMVYCPAEDVHSEDQSAGLRNNNKKVSILYIMSQFDKSYPINLYRSFLYFKQCDNFYKSSNTSSTNSKRFVRFVFIVSQYTQYCRYT